MTEDRLPLLSVLIPAHDEAACLPGTLAAVIAALDAAAVPLEIVVVDDHSGDGTAESVRRFAAKEPRVRLAANTLSRGYGCAVRCGLAECRGDAVAVVMADSSDDPADIAAYYRELLKGYDCVFGSRFRKGACVRGYPWPKLVLNRLANRFIQALFLLPYDDVTNAFKCYSRKALDGIAPLSSRRFELTIEMPLKAILKGYSWSVVPVRWEGRVRGVSKWKIQELGSGYLKVVAELWLRRLSATGQEKRA